MIIDYGAFVYNKNVLAEIGDFDTVVEYTTGHLEKPVAPEGLK